LWFLEERGLIPSEKYCGKCEENENREIRGKKEYWISEEMHKQGM